MLKITVLFNCDLIRRDETKKAPYFYGAFCIFDLRLFSKRVILLQHSYKYVIAAQEINR